MVYSVYVAAQTVTEITDPKRTQLVAKPRRKSRDDSRSALIGGARQMAGHVCGGYLEFWETNSGRYENLQQRQQQRRRRRREDGDGRNDNNDNNQPAERERSVPFSRPPCAPCLSLCCPGRGGQPRRRSLRNAAADFVHAESYLANDRSE